MSAARVPCWRRAWPSRTPAAACWASRSSPRGRSPGEGRCRVVHRAAVVRRGRRRRHRRSAQQWRGARPGEHRQGQEQDPAGVGCGKHGNHRQVMLALGHALDGRYLCVGQRHGARGRGPGWRQLVLPDRRLQLRLRPRSQRQRNDQVHGRPRAGQRAPSAGRAGLLLVPAAGPVQPRQDRRACRAPASIQ